MCSIMDKIPDFTIIHDTVFDMSRVSHEMSQVALKQYFIIMKS